MALTSEREKLICERYRARQADGKVHCKECPLNDEHYGVDMPPMTCKAIMHYDRHKREWVEDMPIDADG